MLLAVSSQTPTPEGEGTVARFLDIVMRPLVRLTQSFLQSQRVAAR
jgi:hypothetical protein